MRLLPTAEVHAHTAHATSIWESGDEDYDLVIQAWVPRQKRSSVLRDSSRLCSAGCEVLKERGTALRRANIYLSNEEKHEFRLDADV